MQVVVIPDHRTPVVTHMVWYQNGSADDPPGKSGIAHFLEHLMFKGTKAHPKGFSDLIAELGGQENAFTAYDYTAYFQRVAKEHLATMMSLEADRMTGLILTDDVVAPERDVVLEERRMRTDTDPAQQLNEAVQASLFPHHPYGTPVIGWGHEIETLDRGDALTYYERFYTPVNAILIVAGDVEAAEVGRLARETYGRIAAREKPPRRFRPQEPEPRAHRLVTLEDPKVEQPAQRARFPRALLHDRGTRRSRSFGSADASHRRRPHEPALSRARYRAEARGRGRRLLHGHLARCDAVVDLRDADAGHRPRATRSRGRGSDRARRGSSRR
jgi:zinc protease